MTKKCFIIAGPNGAGKTTFAMDLLPEEVNCKNYINADLIAQGLSPFEPELAAVQAGKLMLFEIKKCVNSNVTFAFETTLSGRGYEKKIKQWKNIGYEIILYYFSLPSADMAVERVKYRVSQGGHNIPVSDIRRRYIRSKENFEQIYSKIVDMWVVFDTSGVEPYLVRSSVNEK